MKDYSVTIQADNTVSVHGLLRTVDEMDALIRLLTEVRDIAFQETQSGGCASVEGGENYGVILVSTGERSLDVMRTLRRFAGMGVSEAKQMAELGRPVAVLEGVDLSLARALRDMLARCGAHAYVLYPGDVFR